VLVLTPFVSILQVVKHNADWVFFIGTIRLWRESVNRCHKALAVASALPDDGHLTPHERQAFDEVIELMETMGRDYQRG